MDITGNNNLDLVFDSSLGGLQITKDASGRLKSAKFTNLRMSSNTRSFTVSANILIGN